MRNTADGEYLAGLATQLRTAPAITRATEDDLARMRHAMTLVAAFINNPAYDLAARTALATTTGLPEPRTEPR